MSGKLTKAQFDWLERISNRGGTWCAGPFLRDKDSAGPLMRAGLVEAVAPPSPYLPYVFITPAGRAALHSEGEKR